MFDSCFMNSVFRIIAGTNCWDLVEDSDTEGPSSISIRMEYLCAFQYWYCELCLQNRWVRGIVLLIFVLWWCLNFRCMRDGVVVQRGGAAYSFALWNIKHQIKLKVLHNVGTINDVFKKIVSFCGLKIVFFKFS